MVEIRTINEGECDEYLGVLCDVFELDFDRARTAFFSEPYYSLDRKWSLVRKGKIVSILTVVPLEFGDGPGIGIAGVATVQDRRDQGHATDLLNHVCDFYSKRGADKALLFARSQSLYHKAGFSELDKVYLQPLPAGRAAVPRQLDKEHVRDLYDAWAKKDDRRLRRDEDRWKYWSWTFKTPLALGAGYFCYESSRIREVLPTYDRLPISELVDFYGTGELARDLGIETSDANFDLLLMGRGFDYVPRMFMTDQF
jgi:predicted acetyltransferase